MFMLLPIMLQALASPPPPPVTLHTRAVPPPVFNPYPVAAEGEKGPAVPIKIALYLGKETLWSGNLSVGAVPARLSLNEAVDIKSDCGTTGYRGNARNIEITLSRQTYRATNAFMLTARYSRPAQDGLCPAGIRAVSIEQIVLLDAGRVTIEGDGGFHVVLTK